MRLRHAAIIRGTVVHNGPECESTVTVDLIISALCVVTLNFYRNSWGIIVARAEVKGIYRSKNR